LAWGGICRCTRYRLHNRYRREPMETARNGSSMRGSARFSGSTTGLSTLSVITRHPIIGRCRKYLLFSIKIKWTTRLNISWKNTSVGWVSISKHKERLDKATKGTDQYLIFMLKLLLVDPASLALFLVLLVFCTAWCVAWKDKDHGFHPSAFPIRHDCCSIFVIHCHSICRYILLPSLKPTLVAMYRSNENQQVCQQEFCISCSVGIRWSWLL